jgi:hypothetical protein
LGLIVFKVTTGCYPSKGYIVESDLKGKLDHYKFFAFSLLPPELQNPTIEKVLKSRLELQGYHLTADSPDFFVTYRMFNGTPNFYGHKKIRNKKLVEIQNIFQDNQLLSDLEQVTVLILFTDFQSGTVVFQSYVSEIYHYPNVENDVRLRTAVHKAFDKFKLFSAGYYARNT